MALIRINSGPSGPVLAGGGHVQAALAEGVHAIPDAASIIVLLHGLRHSPSRRDTDPHGHIFAYRPDPTCWKAVSWPRRLGFGRGDPMEGLCIPFAWDGALRLGEGYRRAGQAGRQLAGVLDQIEALAPGRRVEIVAHSLGARVALKAIKRTRARIGRVILIAPAEFQGPAKRALDTHAGQAAEVIHIAPRENRLFDHLFQLGAPRRRWGDVALGLRPVRAPNWVTLNISDAATRAHLGQAGFPLPAPGARICHWSGYLRPGLFRLYRAALRMPRDLPLGALRPPPAASGFFKYSLTPVGPDAALPSKAHLPQSHPRPEAS